MKTLLLSIAITLAATATAPVLAQRAPTYDQARKITDQVRATVDGLYRWDKMPAPDRLQAVRSSNALVETSNSVFGADVFGPWAACVKMVLSHQQLVQTLNMAAHARERGSPADGHKMADMARTAFEAGDSYRSCREATEKLQVARKG